MRLVKSQIKFLKRRLGSREKVAKAIGVSPGSVFNWEHGTIPHRRHRQAIVEAMGAGPKARILRMVDALRREILEL